MISDTIFPLLILKSLFRVYFQTQPPTKPNAAAAVKPTKYHYYPHNQHIYLLPECATQQVSINCK